MKKSIASRKKKIAGMACILVFGCLLSVLSCSHAQAGAGTRIRRRDQAGYCGWPTLSWRDVGDR